GLRMTNEKFHRLFDGPPRNPSERLAQRHMDLAASIQAVTGEIVLRMTEALARGKGIPDLWLPGGGALNCVAEGEVRQAGHFRDIWIQPAAGDAGGALGAALAATHLFLGQERKRPEGYDAMHGAYLGPSFEQPEIERRLRAAGAVFTTADDETALLAAVVDALVQEKAIGWFQGRMEFGPRALGSRALLAHPRSAAL